MLTIKLITNGSVQQILANMENTPQQILDENSINISGSTVSLNGRPMAFTDYDTSFAALGVQEGATVLLSAIVKADSAC